MATVKIVGKVAEVINESYPRIKVWETYEFRGEARNRLWTAWLEGSTMVQKDDEVSIEGSLGTKVGIYNKPGQDTKNVVEHSINSVIVMILKSAEPKTEAAEIDINKTPSMPF